MPAMTATPHQGAVGTTSGGITDGGYPFSAQEARTGTALWRLRFKVAGSRQAIASKWQKTAKLATELARLTFPR